MDEHPVIGSEYDLCRGSAWAELDEAFYELVQDLFGDVFCEGAGALLASNDPLHASMRRHPSSRRRF